MITLVVLLLVVCLAVWAAQSAPPPFSFVLWALVVLLVVYALLDVAGALPGHVLRLR